jgi:hypothetical protein
MNEMRLFLSFIVLIIISTFQTKAQYITAEDNAGNYSDWNNGSNQGFGFGAWDLWNSGTSGRFLGSSSGQGFGDIDTDSKAFGMYGNPSGDNYANAQRLVNNWADGASFTIDLAIAYRNGAKGIDIFATGFENVFNFNASSDKYFAGGVEQSTWAYSQTSIFTITISQNGNDLDISIVRGTDTYSTTISSKTFHAFKLYVGSTNDGNDLNNLFFNNLKVEYSDPLKVPETANVKINGNVDLAHNQTLTVNDLTVPGANSFTIKSTTAGTGSLITNGTVTGDVAVERHVAKDNSWHFMSIPINQGTMPEILDGNFAPVSGDFNNINGATYDFYKWFEGAAIGEPNWINLKNDDWTVNTSDFGTPPRFEFGKGYLVAYSATYAGNETKSVTGTLTNGAVNIAVTNAGNTYNLIANPYPSSIDWKAASGWTRTVIEEFGGNNIWIWNGSSGQFGAYNSSSGGDNGTNGVTRYIAPGQAFFVKTSSSGNIGMTNDVRVHSSQAWLKASELISNTLRISVGNNVNSYTDETIVEFGHENIQGGAEKFNSMFSAAPALYSMKNDKQFSINFLGEVNENVLIPMGFKAGVEALYTLQFEGTDQFEIIKLYDKSTGSIQDLKTNVTYSFSATPADLADRFEIHFGALSINESSTQTAASAYVHNSTLYILNASGQTQVDIIDLQGRMLQSSSFRADGLYSQSFSQIPGVYVVRIADEKGVRTAKVVVE